MTVRVRDSCLRIDSSDPASTVIVSQADADRLREVTDRPSGIFRNHPRSEGDTDDVSRDPGVHGSSHRHGRERYADPDSPR